ncbi:hypothetical protein C0995_002713 [Termitomyces sp. Mi166|nr:hypothetical protein C0995_002713 [Termitomyces sp. Mi166\
MITILLQKNRSQRNLQGATLTGLSDALDNQFANKLGNKAFSNPAPSGTPSSAGMTSTPLLGSAPAPMAMPTSVPAAGDSITLSYTDLMDLLQRFSSGIAQILPQANGLPFRDPSFCLFFLVHLFMAGPSSSSSGISISMTDIGVAVSAPASIMDPSITSIAMASPAVIPLLTLSSCPLTALPTTITELY